MIVSKELVNRCNHMRSCYTLKQFWNHLRNGLLVLWDQLSHHPRKIPISWFCTDYVTKWVEEKEINKATKQVVSCFLFEDIFVHFGIPREILIDGGHQFTYHLIQNMVEKYKILHRITLPYHPRENRQVESTNKVIDGILTKTVANHQRDWDNKIPEVLWAYRTIWRSTMRFSLY